MTLHPPNPNIQPRYGEEISNARLHQILRQIQQNFDFINQQFPVQGGNLASAGVVKTPELSSRMIAGSVSGAGAVISGSGFAASRVTSGIYSISFASPLSRAPIVVGSDGAGTGRTFSSFTHSKEGFTVVMTFGVTLEDTLFHFIAIG